MDPWQEDSEYFVEWMLLGEVTRAPSGQRQRQPMAGAWMSYGPGKGMRGSDLRLRRFLCIEALARTGMPIEKGAAFVAGKGNSRRVDVIRNGYYEIKRRQHRPLPGSMDLLGIWFRFYLSWRNSILYSHPQALQQSLARYRAAYGEARARRLRALMTRIRRDKVLISLACLYNRIGPLALSLLERDIGSLRELARKLRDCFRGVEDLAS